MTTHNALTCIMIRNHVNCTTLNFNKSGVGWEGSVNIY